ncbi:hypothetical protein [Nodularia sp. NIES-3585]|uniref:hypothetical protein n=1 Tax=Nodularia sp. NIES-3585 TaxID=1973477 RepID=UPI0011304846|nr:hypothetical protein [Nodularia sp. NIES-3585]
MYSLIVALSLLERWRGAPAAGDSCARRRHRINPPLTHLPPKFSIVLRNKPSRCLSASRLL